jgi:hypothetical protein
MLQRYPSTLRWRQALPPLFVLSLAVLAVLGVWFRPAWVLWSVELGTYFALITMAGLWTAIRDRRAAYAAGLPMAIATMHLAWGGGFLWSMIPGSTKMKNG